MLNQGQGTYPQLAGSFYNSQQMMPHDNGRNARQVPTFFGGLQNMMSASTAMQNYQGVPMGQGILNTQALASQQYVNSMPGVVSGVGTGLGLASTVAGVGAFGATKAAAAGLIGKGLGASIAGGLGTVAGATVALPLMIAGGAAMGIVHSYKKRMAAMDDMRNALEGSRFGYGLADPITGNLSHSAALTLSRQMQASARGSGFKDNDLKNIMGTASGLGMLNGMQSLSQVTKKVVDLAKASKEIVMLGEGISMTDAMQLQKLTQDMGISTSKFRSSNIGKNIVMAARASSMSMGQASQVAGMGAVTYQQLGLGAASGMNAALYGNMAAAGLAGVGAFNPRQLAALGGQQGIAQHLLAGQASTMARMSDALVMGAVKLGEDGSLGINRELLDQYTRGEVSRKELIERGKKLGKGMSKGARSKLMEELQFSMPRLREEMSDSLTSEEQMAIQARGILELKARTGMSTRRAAHAYFQDASQAEAYLGYAQNFEAVRGENNRQLAIADQEKMLRYASMAKSSGGMAQAGRAIARGFSALGDDLYKGLGLEAAGEYLADVTVREQEDANRGLRRIMGVSNTVRGQGDLQDLGSFGSSLYGDNRRESFLERTGHSSYHSYFKTHVKGRGRQAYRDYERRTGQTSGVNVIGNAGIGQRVTELREGDYSAVRKIGDFLGIDGFADVEDIYEQQALATDASIEIGRLTRSSNFRMNDNISRNYYNQAVARLRQIGTQAAMGEEVAGEGGQTNFNGVDSRQIYPEELRKRLNYETASPEEKEKIDAAIGQAYRFMQSGDSGKSQQGFSKMLKTVSAAGTLHFLTDEMKVNVDEVKLSKGRILRSEGLSRAIQESGVTARNLGALTNLISTGGDKLTGYGDAKASLGTILQRAGINVSKSEVGRYRRLVDALMKAQVETTDKKGDSVITDLTSGLGTDFGGTKEEIDALVAQGALDETKAGYMRKQLAMLDARVAEGVVGEAGKELREDLARNLYATEDLQAKTAAKQMRDRDMFIGERFAYRQNRIQARIKEIEEGYAQGGAKDRALSEARERAFKHKNIHRSGRESINTNTDDYREYQRLRQERIAAGKELRTLKDTDSADYILKAKGYDAEFYDKLASGELDAGIDPTADDADRIMTNTGGSGYLREKYGANKGLLGHSSLKGMLEGIASTDEEKKAYAKLLDSEGGAALITSFRKMRRGYAELSPEKKRAADQQMLREIIAAAERQKINVPGSGQSKSLPELLSEIAGGIKDFRNAMSSIAKLKSEKGTVTFQLVGPGEKQ